MQRMIDERTTHPYSRAEFQRILAAAYCRELESTPSGVEEEDDRSTPEIADGLDRIANAKIQHLSKIMQQLNELWSGPERDDYGILRPSKHAYIKASELMVDAAIIAAIEYDRGIPFGCVATDSEGSVRIEWTSPDASVRLVVPASENESAYVFHEVGKEYDTEDATPEGLSRWLRNVE